MQTKSDLQDIFADYIFRFPYRRLLEARKAFCDLHAEEYINYRKIIARRGREIRRRNLNQNEYKNYIWKWYMDRVRMEDVLEGMTTGDEWAKGQGMPVNSIGLFHTFVVARWKVFQDRLESHLSRYNAGEGYARKDRWYFDLFCNLYLRYDDRVCFDPWWGYREREKVYTGVLPGCDYVVLATDQSMEDLEKLAERAGVTSGLQSEPIPHYRLTRLQRERATRCGARKADRVKMVEIAGCRSESEKAAIEPAVELEEVSGPEFERIMDVVQKTLDKPTFEKWILPLSCMGRGKGAIYFGSAQVNKISWIKQNLLEKINIDMGKEFGMEIKINRIPEG